MKGKLGRQVPASGLKGVNSLKPAQWTGCGGWHCSVPKAHKTACDNFMCLGMDLQETHGREGGGSLYPRLSG